VLIVNDSSLLVLPPLRFTHLPFFILL